MENTNQKDINIDMPLYVRANDFSPLRRLAPKVSRNDICPLENKKFKKCCGAEGINFCKKLLNQYFDSNNND